MDTDVFLNMIFVNLLRPHIAPNASECLGDEAVQDQRSLQTVKPRPTP